MLRNAMNGSNDFKCGEFLIFPLKEEHFSDLCDEAEQSLLWEEVLLHS